jgi:hypothetical protein
VIRKAHQLSKNFATIWIAFKFNPASPRQPLLQWWLELDEVESAPLAVE